MSAIARELLRVDATANAFSSDVEWYSVADGRKKETVRFPFSPVVYVRDLPVDGRTHDLPFPLKLEVSPGEDCSFALFAPALGIGGRGATFDQAVRDLAKTALSLLGVYSRESVEHMQSFAAQALQRMQAALGLSRVTESDATAVIPFDEAALDADLEAFRRSNEGIRMRDLGHQSPRMLELAGRAAESLDARTPEDDEESINSLEASFMELSD